MLSPCYGQTLFMWAFPIHPSEGHPLPPELWDWAWPLLQLGGAPLLWNLHVCTHGSVQGYECGLCVRNEVGGPGLCQPLAVMRTTVVVTANTLGLSPPQVVSTPPPAPTPQSGFCLPEPEHVPRSIWPLPPPTPPPPPIPGSLSLPALWSPHAATSQAWMQPWASGLACAAYGPWRGSMGTREGASSGRIIQENSLQ